MSWQPPPPPPPPSSRRPLPPVPQWKQPPPPRQSQQKPMPPPPHKPSPQSSQQGPYPQSLSSYSHTPPSQPLPPPPPTTTSTTTRQYQASTAVPPPPMSSLQHGYLYNNRQHGSQSLRPPPPPSPIYPPAKDPPPRIQHQHYSNPPIPPPPPTPTGLHTSSYPPMNNTTNAASTVPSSRYSGPPRAPPNPYPQQSPYPPTPLSPRPHYPGTDSARSNRIDASQIPTVPLPTRPHNDNGVDVYYPKGHCQNVAYDNVTAPPAPDSRFVVLDDGNASPHMLRSTMYAVPMDRGVLRQAGDVALGCVSIPMGLPSQDFRNPLPSDGVEMPESGRLGYVPLERSCPPESPPRCSQCYAYVTPYWDGSRKCTFCLTRNNRVDSSMGNSMGTVEYNVSGPYVTRKQPVQPNVVYAIDATAPDCLEYIRLLMDRVLPAYYQHVQLQLQQQQQQQMSSSANYKVECRVGIVLVSCSGIYIPAKKENKFIVMPDVQQEPFSPLPLQEWTHDFSSPDEYEAMTTAWKGTLLQSLVPKLLSQVHKLKHIAADRSWQYGFSFSCGGAALQFLVDALQESGGRAVWISWRRPNHGIGKILDRQEKCRDRAYMEYEGLLYSSMQDCLSLAKVKENLETTKFYIALAKRSHQYKVTTDIVLHTDPEKPKSFLDVATLSKFCSASNGKLIWIDHNKKIQWVECFVQELLRPLLQYSGWDAVLKVRCSTGLQVRTILSSVGVSAGASSLIDESSSDELELAVVAPDSSFGVLLEHRVGGLPKNQPPLNEFCFIQTALLYTNVWTGERRVRVSTLCLRTTASPQVVFRSLDFHAIITLQMRSYLSKLAPEHDQAGESALVDARHSLVQHCLDIFTAYRKLPGPTGSSSSQLVLPDKLRLLPLFYLSLRKSSMLRSALPRKQGMYKSATPSPTVDERAYHLQFGNRANPSTAMLIVHPFLFNLSDISSDEIAPWFISMTPEQLKLQDPTTQLRKCPYVKLPDPLQPTVASLDDDGIYLLDACFVFYVLVGKQVPDERYRKVQEQAQNSTSNDHPLGRCIQQLRMFSQVGRTPQRWLRPMHAPVVVVHQTHHSAKYQSILKSMVFDAALQERDYVDFLCELHKRVQKLVAN